MTASRRELYAAGEPFGDCATREKPGGRIYGGGGADGGPRSRRFGGGVGGPPAGSQPIQHPSPQLFAPQPEQNAFGEAPSRFMARRAQMRTPYQPAPMEAPQMSGGLFSSPMPSQQPMDAPMSQIAGNVGPVSGGGVNQAGNK